MEIALGVAVLFATIAAVIAFVVVRRAIRLAFRLAMMVAVLFAVIIGSFVLWWYGSAGTRNAGNKSSVRTTATNTSNAPRNSRR